LVWRRNYVLCQSWKNSPPNLGEWMKKMREDNQSKTKLLNLLLSSKLTFIVVIHYSYFPHHLMCDLYVCIPKLMFNTNASKCNISELESLEMRVANSAKCVAHFKITHFGLNLLLLPKLKWQIISIKTRIRKTKL